MPSTSTTRTTAIGRPLGAQPSRPGAPRSLAARRTLRAARRWRISARRGRCSASWPWGSSAGAACPCAARADGCPSTRRAGAGTCAPTRGRGCA
eukprot:12261726-Alexandrium_andersonii.AAC.1